MELVSSVENNREYAHYPLESAPTVASGVHV